MSADNGYVIRYDAATDAYVLQHYLQVLLMHMVGRHWTKESVL